MIQGPICQVQDANASNCGTLLDWLQVARELFQDGEHGIEGGCSNNREKKYNLEMI
jgi:hypothetical protein